MQYRHAVHQALLPGEGPLTARLQPACLWSSSCAVHILTTTTFCRNQMWSGIAVHLAPDLPQK